MTANICQHHGVCFTALSKVVLDAVDMLCKRIGDRRVVGTTTHHGPAKVGHRRNVKAGVPEPSDQFVNQVDCGAVESCGDSLGYLRALLFGRSNHSVRSLAVVVESFGNCTLPRLAKGRPAWRTA